MPTKEEIITKIATLLNDGDEYYKHGDPRGNRRGFGIMVGGLWVASQDMDDGLLYTPFNRGDRVVIVTSENDFITVRFLDDKTVAEYPRDLFLKNFQVKRR